MAWDVNEDRNEYYNGSAFLYTESMELKEIPSPNYLYDMDEMAVMIDHDSGKLEIADPDNRWVVKVLDEEAGERGDDLDDRSFAYGSNVLVEHRWEGDSERIRIWKVGHAPMLLKDLTFEFRERCTINVDERFIVVGQSFIECKFGTLYFYSTETLEVFTSLSAMDYQRAYDRGRSFQTRVNGNLRTSDVGAGSFNPQNCKWQYSRGLLFQSLGNGIVRILDVASGTHFNDVRMPFRKEDGRSVQFLDTWASSNSTCVVIGWKYSTMCGMYSHLSVYDLEAVKKANSDPGSRLLYTLQFQFDMQKFAMDDFRLAFNGNDGKNNRYVTVLKFANFGFVERKTSDWEDNSEANEDIQMKMIYDPCVNFPPLDSRKSVRTLNKSAEPMKTQGRNHLNFVNRLKWQRRKSCDNVTYFLCE